MEIRPHLRLPPGGARRSRILSASCLPWETALAWLDRRRGVADRYLLTLAIVTMLAFSVAPILNAARAVPNKDYDLWFEIGRAYLHGDEIYRTRSFTFIYPPGAAGMLAAASAGGRAFFVPLLLVLNSLAWLASSLLSVRLTAGAVRRQHPAMSLLPALGVIFWVYDTYLLGQPALVLLALVLGAAACLRIGRPWSAGALVGTAAAIKAYPLAIIPYLAYRRHWKAAASGVFVLGAWTLLLPMLFRGPGGSVADLGTWTHGVVLDYDAQGAGARADRAFSFRNQSLLGVGNRLLRAVPADERNPNWKVNLVRLDFVAANGVILVLAGGLTLLFVLAAPPASLRTPASDAIEWAALLLLVLFLSPLSFNYSYVWLLFPLTVATRLTLQEKEGSSARHRDIAWLAASLLVQAIALAFRLPAQAYGNVLLCGLILFAGLAVSLRRTWSSPTS